jgi:hypothetical protein
MAQVLKLKRTAVTGKTPTTSHLELGELAMNTFDGRIFLKKDNGTPIVTEILTTNTENFITGSLLLNGNLTLTGNATIGGNLTLGGNITIGDNVADVVTVTAGFSGSLIPDATSQYDLGSITKKWNNLHVVSASADYFIGDGSGLTNVVTQVSEQASVTASFSNQDEITIVHGFDSRNIHVSVYDSSNQLIIPESVTLTTTNQVDVTLQSGTTGYVVVAKGGHILSGSVSERTSVTASFENENEISVYHGFDSRNIHVSVYDNIHELIIPESIKLSTPNQVDVTLQANTTGYVVVAQGGHLITGERLISQETTVTASFSDTDSVTITHNFGTKNVLVSIYNELDRQIIPDEVTLTDENTVDVTLYYPTTGFVVIAKAGHIVQGTLSDSDKLDGQQGSYYLDFTNFTNIPSGLVSGSSQIILQSTTGDISGSRIDGPVSKVNSDILSGSGIYSFLLRDENFEVGQTNNLVIGIDNLSQTIISPNFQGDLIGTADTASLSLTTPWSGLIGKPSDLVSGSSQLTSSFDTRYTISGSVQPLPTGLISASSQVSFNSISDVPTGLISASSQVSFNSISDVPSGLVSGSVLRTLDGTNVVSGSVLRTLDGTAVVSGSSQISFTGISDVPSGLISSSTQLTSSYDTRYSLSGSIDITQLNLFTSSYYTDSASFDTRITSIVASGSGADWDTNLENIPSGLVSSSLQITNGSGIVSGSVVTTLDGTGVFSGSSQVNFNDITDNPFSSSATEITVTNNLIPDTTETYDIGSPTNRFKDLYLSGSTIDLGGTLITRDGNGDVNFKDSQTQNLKKIVVEELQIGTGVNARKIKVDDGIIKFTDTNNIDKVDESLSLPSGIISGSSQINFNNISNIPVGLVSSSAQVSNLTASLDSYRLVTDEKIRLIEFSTSSLQGRVTSLENFSSSLDQTYATDVELLSITQSLIDTQLINKLDTSVHLTTSASFHQRINGIAASGSGADWDTNLQNIPSGLISSSNQLPSGLVSGSSQINYNSITNTPSIPTDINQLTDNDSRLFDGSYNSLSNKPTLFDGDYNNLSNRPNLFDGNYNSLSNRPTIPTTISDISGGTGVISGSSQVNYNNISNKPSIPTSLTDLSISDGSNGQVLTTNGSGVFTFQTPSGGSADTGDVTFTNSTINTDNSSDITITPNVTMSADLVIENDVTIVGNLDVGTITNSGVGTATFEAGTNLELEAGNVVHVKSSPLRLASFTTTERNTLAAQNGDLIYNTTLNKFQGYQNGTWVNIS